MDYQPKTQDPDVRHVKKNGPHLAYYKHNNRVLGPVWNRKEDGYSYWMKNGEWFAAPRLFSGAPDFDNAIGVGFLSASPHVADEKIEFWTRLVNFMDMAETRMRGAGLNL